MGHKLLISVWLIVGCFAVQAADTLRLDYFHSGNATEEMFSLDELVVEPLPWPGNPRQPIDQLKRGKYLLEVCWRPHH